MTRSTHPYGSDPSQLGELFLPQGAGPHPVAVVVHGGYWRARYDRSLMTELCLDLADRGLAAWNVEYRRVESGGGWPETLEDVAAVSMRSPTSTRCSISSAWLRSVTPREVTSSGPPPDRRFRMARPAPGLVYASAQPSPRPVSSTYGSRHSSGPPRSPRARCSAIPTSMRTATSSPPPQERVPLGIPQLVLHGDRDDTVSIRIATS